jgi:hypothetical protein
MPGGSPPGGPRVPGASVTDLAKLLAANMLQLCQQLLPSGRKVGREWHVGDCADNPGDSLKIVLTGAKAGAWQDFARGEKGDAIALVRACLRLSLPEACRWAERFLALDPATNPPPPRSNGANGHDGATASTTPPAKIAALWAETRPLDGTLGQRYLQGRGITVSVGPWVRFHPRLPYWHVNGAGPVKLGTFPALICGIALWGSLEPIALHRIYLAPDGTGKARVPDPSDPTKLLDPKKTFGPARGGAVRLSRYHDGGDLIVSEGVETAASVLQTDRSGAAVWACLGTSGLANVVLPPGLKRLFVAADGEDSGQIAAERLIARAEAIEPDIIAALVEHPGYVFSDWNDKLMEKPQ